MTYPLELASLNILAQDILTATGLSPFTFFLASITLAILLYAFDLNKGLSLDVPGRGQIGLSASVFIFGALIMILGAEGYQFFFIEIAKTALGLVIIAPAVYFLLNRD